MANISKIKLQDTTYVIKDLDAYVKPSTGIPASDFASGVIPDVSNFITNSVNDLANYYLKSDTYTKTEVAELIGAINQFHYEIAASTSAVDTPASNVLYLIGPTGSGSDQYEEYVYTSDWVKIGDTSIDLSDYVTTTALNTALADYTTTADLITLLAGKQDTINDLSDIRSGAAAGATALQSYTETDPTVPDWAKASTKPSYSYSEISNTPSLGTAASKDVAASGDASTTEVVMGNDSRLTDARNAADVYSWAKASTKPNYSYNEISGTPTIPTKTSELTNDSGFLTSHQDISGKADKSEMSVSTSGDQTTITLKSGTSTTVINAHQSLSGKQDVISDLETIRSGAALGATAVQTETDPTVPSWAKASTKPSYNLDEVIDGSNRKIPTKTSDLTNDSGFLTEHQDISGKEDKSNKVTSLSASSTDTQYPSAKVVYDQLETKLPKEGYKENYPNQEFVYRKAPATTTNSKFLTLDRIYGKTLVWNQQADTRNISIESVSWASKVFSSKSVIAGHKYFFRGNFINGVGQNIIIGNSGVAIFLLHNNSRDIVIRSDGYQGFLLTCPDDFTKVSVIKSTSGTVVDVNDCFFVDLTLMFGAGNEPSTVAEFEALYPLSYYDYNAGELISNEAKAIETVGFNLWDEEWEEGQIDTITGQDNSRTDNIRSKNYIPVIPDTSYFLTVGNSSTYHYYLFYDANKNYLGYSHTSYANPFVTPSNCAYVRFFTREYGATYNNDICINLSDPVRNGTYEPYQKATAVLNLNSFQVKDSEGNTITIEGGLKSAGSVRDEIVGNKYVKRVGEMDLGTLEWGYNSTTSGSEAFYASMVSSGAKKGVHGTLPNIICSKYGLIDCFVTFSMMTTDKACTYHVPSDNFNLLIRDTAYTDATAFKAAMQGVMLNYELATPIEYELVTPIAMTMTAGTTEERISPNEEGLSAPMVADIIYSWDYDKYIEITENKYNKVKTISALSTDLEYPSAKAVYNAIKTIDSADLSHFDVFGNHLIAQNTANSYVVHRPGIYKIPLIYGNGIYNSQINARAYTKLASDYTADFVNHLGNVITSPYIEENSGCTASSAGLLWQTSNCINAVNIVEDLGVKYLMFVVNSIPDTNADAVLYVRDTNNNIMWSWTIWMVNNLPSNVDIVNYTGVTYIMMGLPFGAIWNAEKTKYVVPLYQWGRKDPMVPAAAYNSNGNMTVYDINGNVYSGFGSLGTGNDSLATKTVANAIQNPNLFFTYYNTTTYNWNSLSWMNNFWNAAETSSSSLEDNQATAIKTIYDPSPVGYMLPSGRFATGFTTTGSNTSTASEFNVIGSFNNGWTFKKNSSDTSGIFFPAAGFRYASSSGLNVTGSNGYWWSFAPGAQTYARYLDFYSGNVYPLYGYGRAYGFGVWAALELH